mgnify:CR=1 FL=1
MAYQIDGIDGLGVQGELWVYLFRGRLKNMIY